ncbi:hypothetical protein UFOVP1298_19 [uncultured Caudovirales phage]|uniref:Uncharacterized protein n=1 Tax=uncultured Caudovirales phage TaxID=2100421 RepID=A0A6J5REG7_9CAUD|nr:hypothetical protein UFOVP1298_19 [uncultured Caudovirales phage]
MSFQKTGITLPNSAVLSNKFQLCNKCLKEKPPEGGVEMSPTKWICARCWTIRATRTQPLGAKSARPH